MWRHPSELAAEQRAIVRAEPPTMSTRVFALTTGSLGLLAIGMLLMTVTPKRQESPSAISAITTPRTVAESTASPVASFVSNLESRSIGFADRSMTVAAGATLPLATPIGDGRFAVLTRVGLAGNRGPVIDVLLPSGEIDDAVVVSEPDQSIVVVALAHATSGYEVARDAPRSDELVTLLASPPVTVVFADIGSIPVTEGTAVLNSDGSLVGLCTHAGDGTPMTLLIVSDEFAASTTAGR